MSEITCNCPHCGQELNIDSQFSGQTAACPSCNGEFGVPDAPPSNAPMLQAPAPGAAPPPRLNMPNAPAPGPRPPQMSQPLPQSPYQSPTSNVAGPQGYGYGMAPGPSPSTITLLAQTKGWILLFAILYSIAPVMLLIFGIIILAGGALGGALGQGTIAGGMLILFGLLVFLPAWRLWQYNGAIKALRFTPHIGALDHAIDRQRCFWKTIGILWIIGTAISIVMFLLGLNSAA